ncbi:MAG: hypothetical protein J5I90_02565 [Caldilineales bacterium]|nr:hypothetical protein [Caldilineales bacterium]
MPYQFTPFGRVVIHVERGDVVVHGQAGRKVASLIAKDVDSVQPSDEQAQETHLRVQGSVTLTLPNDVALSLQGDIADVVLRSLAEVQLSGCRGDVVANELAALQVDGELRGDVALRQIRGAVSLQSVRGDLAGGHLGSLKVTQVKSDVSLVSVQDVQIGVVGGDLSVTHADSVLVREVKGNAALSSVTGTSELKRVGGDLAVGSPGASLTATDVNGDSGLRGPLLASGRYWLNAGGDVDARVSGNANLTIRAGGVLRLGTDIELISEEGGLTKARLGEEENPADLSIDAKGDVAINSPQYAGKRKVAAVETELRQTMSEVQRELGRAADSISQATLADVNRTDLSATVGMSVRSVVRDLLDSLSNKVAPPPPPAAKVPPVSPAPAKDELKMIMEMLASGVITVEEAEQLIAALDNSS